MGKAENWSSLLGLAVILIAVMGCGRAADSGMRPPPSWMYRTDSTSSATVAPIPAPAPSDESLAPDSNALSGAPNHIPGSKMPKYHYPTDRHEVKLPFASFSQTKQEHLLRREDGTWVPRRPDERVSRKGRRHRHHRKKGKAGKGSCPPCPADRTVIAPKGRDFVLMEALTDAENRPLQPVSGPRTGDALSEGAHRVAVRLPGRARVCRFTYNVAVRRCPPLSEALEKGLEGEVTPSARCTSGTSWGSRCHFRCPDSGQQMVGPSSLECGPDLRWSGRSPVCYERRSCPVPPPPEHGLLNCRTPDVDEEGPGSAAPDNNEIQRMAEGSECNITCHEGLLLDIRPRPRVDMATGTAKTVGMACTAGRWNVTLPARCVMPDDLDVRMYDEMDGHIPGMLSDSAIMSNSLGRDACLPNPCLGGGTCLQSAAHFAPVCICPAGIEGERCERAVCGLPCRHGGRCLVVRGTPSCYCRTGFTGPRCQTTVRHVRYPQPQALRLRPRPTQDTKTAAKVPEAS